MNIVVQVCEQDFSLDEQNRLLLNADTSNGAVANFVGLVRQEGSGPALLGMELEHYPGMTEQSIQALVQRAGERWPLAAARVIHRIGSLRPGEQIVYVGVASAHRQAALQACTYIMDYLKTEAPFWKKEHFDSGQSQWVSRRDSDSEALQHWAK